MQIVSTGDLSLELIEEFNNSLPEEFRGTVDEGQMLFRSAEPPSWITLFASLQWWQQVLAGYGGLFLAELTKEAAKDSWRHRSVAVAAAKRVGRAVIFPLAKALEALRSRLPARTTVQIGSPTPDEHFGATLRVSLSSVEDISVDLLFFAMHLPALQVLLTRISADGVLGAVILSIQEDGDMCVEWHGAKDLALHKVVLALPDAV